MRKALLSTILLLMFFSYALPVRAEFVAGNSATIHYTAMADVNFQNTKELALKKKVIKTVLAKYESPLLESVDSFISACREFDLDCYLLPSISGVESTFGKFLIPSTYNPFGWGRGIMPFESFDKAIYTVGKGLRENYINKGAESVEEIGSIYCEGNTWAGKVNFFMKEFRTEEEKQLNFQSDTVQL